MSGRHRTVPANDRRLRAHSVSIPLTIKARQQLPGTDLGFSRQQSQPSGPLYMYHSGGRSVYNGLDLKFTQNARHPMPGVKYLNLQATYTLSRYVNAGSTGSGTGIAGGDSDFVNNAISNRNPLAYIGPGSLDRTNQFNIGGYADLPAGFRLGLLSHFWSPLAATPTVLPVAGGLE